jgi:hypothetical protein
MTAEDKKFFKEMVRRYYPDEFARLHPEEAEAEKQSEKYIVSMSKSELKKRAKALKIKWFSAMNQDQLVDALKLKADGKETELKTLSECVREVCQIKLKEKFKK